MRTVIAPEYTKHADFIARIPSLIAQGQGEIVYDGRNLVVRFRHDGLSLMVKRFKQLNAVQQVVYTYFRKSKAKRAYLYAQEFLRRGIDTPQPVAYMEEHRHGLFITGYFVSIEAEGTEAALLLREVQDYPGDLAEAVARQVMLMHSRGVLHGDLNLTNFLYTQHSSLNTQHSSLNTQHSSLNTQHSSLNTQHSSLNIHHSTLNTHHFTMIDTNRSHFCNGFPSDAKCLKNMVRLTHRRDLYEDLIRRYARLRSWDADATVEQALQLLYRFEHRKIKF